VLASVSVNTDRVRLSKTPVAGMNAEVNGKVTLLQYPIEDIARFVSLPAFRLKPRAVGRVSESQKNAFPCN
jgi:hypothetical protein